MFHVKGGQSDHAKVMNRVMSKTTGAGGLSSQTFPSQQQQAQKENVYREPVMIKSKTQTDLGEADRDMKFAKDLSTEVKKKVREDDDSDDDMFKDDDDDKVLAALRAKRMKEIQSENSKFLEYRKLGHGQYTHVNQDEFLPAVTGSHLCICHFFHNDFKRCGIMDQHLQKLAKKHMTTKFIYIDAEKSPFFVEKMKIQTLPTVVMFRDGIAIDRVLGFEDFEGGKSVTYSSSIRPFDLVRWARIWRGDYALTRACMGNSV